MKNKEFKYKNDHTLEERKNESNRILNEYKDRLPVICEVAPDSVLPPLKKTKYLVSYDMTINQFMFLIRRNIELSKESALFLITPNGISLTGNTSMLDLYNIHKDKNDNFFYLYCDCEITMG